MPPKLSDGMTIMHKGSTYVVGEDSSLIRIPKTARSAKQRVSYLLKRGYVWTAYMFARHSNKLLVSMLQRAHPSVPWKNIAFASKHT